MRLLLSSHGAGPYGAERILLTLAEGLRGRGHEVLLEFPHGGPAVDAAAAAGLPTRVTERRRLPRTAREAFLHVLGIPASIAAVARVTRSYSPAVVWVNSVYNPWAALGARWAGARVVCHLHERSPRGPAGLIAALLIGATATRVVTVSHHLARRYGRLPWLRKRIRVVLNPIAGAADAAPPNRERTIADAAAGPFTIGYVGQLEPRKRAADVVRALAALPDARAVFVGDGKAREALERIAEGAGVADRVRLLGYRDDARNEIAGFDCLAIPSLGEGFGLTAVEAMAAGVPVVAAKSGALPEVLGDAALYFPPRDTKALARQLARLRADSGLRRELRERGLRRARDFDVDPWLDSIEGLLHEIQDREDE